LFSILIIEGIVDTTDAEHYLGCPQHAHKPSAALLAHSEQAALPSHQKAIDNHANKTATPSSASVPWTMSLTLLYSQVIPVNIDAIDPSQPVTSLYSWVTPVNIDPINPSQPVILQIPQAAPNKRAHNKAHGLLSDIDNNGVLININAVLIDIDAVLIDIDAVLIDIDSVLIDIDGVLIDIDVVLIDINSVLIDIDAVLIDINGVLININGVLIDIDVQPLTIVRFCHPGQYKKPRIRIQGDSEE
jgi:hypothetical protein